MTKEERQEEADAAEIASGNASDAYDKYYQNAGDSDKVRKYSSEDAKGNPSDDLLREMAEGRIGQGGLGRGRQGGEPNAYPPPVPLTDPRLSALVKRLVQTVRNVTRSRMRKRSYARPGRITDPYLLKGTPRAPAVRVLIVRDVSGSTAWAEPVLGAIQAGFRSYPEIVPIFGYFAGTFEITRSYKSIPAVGSTTEVKAIWDYLRSHPSQMPDAIVIVTDAEVGNPNPMPKVPVFWVAPYGEALARLPVPQDTKFPLDTESLAKTILARKGNA